MKIIGADQRSIDPNILEGCDLEALNLCSAQCLFIDILISGK